MNIGVVTRTCLLLAALAAALFCVHAGTVYLSAARTQASVDAWFNGKVEPTHSQLRTAQQTLANADSILFNDADIKISLAKVNIVRARKKTGDIYLDAVQRYISEARGLRPTHFEALALQVFLDDYRNQNDCKAVSSLQQLLQIAPFETQVQMLAGPILIKRWYELPAAVQEFAKPLITSALREPSTRETMLSAMGTYKIVAPFRCCSPNRETSARLRALEAEAANATYQ